jgi:hypothetical protein
MRQELIKLNLPGDPVWSPELPRLPQLRLGSNWFPPWRTGWLLIAIGLPPLTTPGSP